MWLRKNPTNETHVHLAKLSRKYGFAIGEFSYGAPKVRFPWSGAKLTIGKYCSIADRVEIFLGGNHRQDWVCLYPFSELPDMWPGLDVKEHTTISRGDVTIGNDVWLASGTTILSGITIGHGAAVAARAVVTKDVPPYALVAGNPARVIRYRFDEAMIAALLETSWWDLPVEKVRALIPLLQSNRVPELLAAIRAL